MGAFAQTPAEAGYELIVARLLAEEGRGREASESYIAAIELAPEDPYIRLEYSKFLARQRRFRRSTTN